jgi:hydroxymethylglutaryl-CoA lyase
MTDKIKITECPRDAMQGIQEFIPTDKKAGYINLLLKAGFDKIDFGSFVSTKAVPQMKDTADVLKMLDLSDTSSKLLAIVVNKRGAEDASKFSEIDYLGFPFSISETFQQRNANSSIEESLKRVEDIQNISANNNKNSVIYLSMAFGNPYGDKYHPEIAGKWVEKLAELEVKTIALSDTIGSSDRKSINELFDLMNTEFPQIEFTAHLHTTPDKWQKKVEAALESGCKSFDSAIKGFGGCPMAKDDLTGNLATENIISYLNDNGLPHSIDQNILDEATAKAALVFP